MTKPDDIPQDVWGEAEEYAVGLNLTVDLNAYDYPIVRESIARAIMAAKAEELSACVSIVQGVGTEWGALEAKQACEEAVFLMLGRAD